jgi:transcriptional regulator with XRE-family HTH domain
MSELRQWRDLTDRRDANVRRAAQRERKSVEQIARAAGLTDRQIRRILSGKDVRPL